MKTPHLDFPPSRQHFIKGLKAQIEMQIKRIGAIVGVQHELQMIAAGQQALQQFTPDTALLIIGQHGDCADVRIKRAVRYGARKAHQAIAVPGGYDVSGSAHQLGQPLSVSGTAFPTNGVEERRQLIEIDFVAVAINDRHAP